MHGSVETAAPGGRRLFLRGLLGAALALGVGLPAAAQAREPRVPARSDAPAGRGQRQRPAVPRCWLDRRGRRYCMPYREWRLRNLRRCWTGRFGQQVCRA